MLTYTLGLILVTWLLSWLLVFLVWPLIANTIGKILPDSGLALSRLGGWLLVSLVVWMAAHLLPLNTLWFVWLVLITGLGGSIFYLVKNGFDKWWTIIARKKWAILLSELLFLTGFISLTLIRAHNPNIQDLEKPMDAGFMNSYMRAEKLPAPDIWLSPHTINYYSFGHFMGSVLSRVWMLPVGLSYNLLLAFIMGLSFSLSFNVAGTILLTWRQKNSSHWMVFLGGLVAAILVTVAGNTHTAWFGITKGTFNGYWYADATRFIERTIHEFPAYSFVVADIHGHVWGLPLVLSFLMVAWWWQKELAKEVESLSGWWGYWLGKIKGIWKKQAKIPTYIAPSVAMGIFLGTFLMTSTWDFLIYGLLLLVLSALLFIYDAKYLGPLLVSGGLALATAVLIALPWIINFKSISEGVRIATEHSPWWQLLVLWTGHVIFSSIALVLAIFGFGKNELSEKRALKASRLWVCALAITAFLLLILPEIIYFKDIYSGHPRANTMFKLTYQAFVMMSILGGVGAGYMGSKNLGKWWYKLPLSLVMLLLMGLMLLFPYFAFRDYYGALKTFKGIYGYSWLQESRPDDYEGILWLNENVVGQPTILEAVGESYTDFAQVSAVTGLPTVLGWRVHEWLWRGGFDIPGQRTTEVEQMYEKPLSAEALKLFKDYQVKYIFIGVKERETYEALSEFELESLGEIVFNKGETKIIKITRI